MNARRYPGGVEPSLAWLFFLAAIILFILAVFVDEHSRDFMLWGLAAFAGGHVL